MPAHISRCNGQCQCTTRIWSRAPGVMWYDMIYKIPPPLVCFWSSSPSSTIKSHSQSVGKVSILKLLNMRITSALSALALTASTFAVELPKDEELGACMNCRIHLHCIYTNYQSALWFRYNDGQDHGEEVCRQSSKLVIPARIHSNRIICRRSGRARVKWDWWRLLHGQSWAMLPVWMVSQSPSPETHCTSLDARMFVTHPTI